MSVNHDRATDPGNCMYDPYGSCICRPVGERFTRDDFERLAQIYGVSVAEMDWYIGPSRWPRPVLQRELRGAPKRPAGIDPEVYLRS